MQLKTSSLNNQQHKALESVGNVLVEAGPGTGKTQLVVAKVETEIRHAMELGRRILCLTFTTAVRRELSSRLGSVLSEAELSAVDVLTISSFCLNQVIRPVSQFIKFGPQIRVATPGTPAYEAALDVATRETGAMYYDVREALKTVWRDQEGQPRCEGIDGYFGSTLSCLYYFWDELKKTSHIDHASVPYVALRVLRNESIANGLAARYGWIIVDEYQDTNVVQVALLERLAATGRSNLFLIGDLNQSIYGFNGADVSRLTAFPKSIGAEKRELSESYRCPEAVCKVAERMFIRNLFPAPQGREGERTGLGTVHFATGNAVQSIIDEFIPACDSMGITMPNIAILSWWNNTLFELVGNLSERGVPCVFQGRRRPDEWFAHFAEQCIMGAFAEDLNCLSSAQDVAAEVLEGFDVLPKERDAVGALSACIREEILGLRQSIIRVEPCNTQITEFRDVLLRAMITSEVVLDSAVVVVKQAMSDEALMHVSLPTETPNQILERLSPTRSLRAMTVHSAKGLEFDAVAVVHVDTRKMPDARARTRARLEEDLRKLYVAVTRAKRFLWIHAESEKSASPYLSILRGESEAMNVLDYLESLL